MYFKSNYENLEGPEDFATKIIYVVTNGEQVYISYNGTIPYPKLGTVSVNVTIMERITPFLFRQSLMNSETHGRRMIWER